jgi:hypothetical protein
MGLFPGATPRLMDNPQKALDYLYRWGYPQPLLRSDATVGHACCAVPCPEQPQKAKIIQLMGLFPGTAPAGGITPKGIGIFIERGYSRPLYRLWITPKTASDYLCSGLSTGSLATGYDDDYEISSDERTISRRVVPGSAGGVGSCSARCGRRRWPGRLCSLCPRAVPRSLARRWQVLPLEKAIALALAGQEAAPAGE